jgi:acyl carrier protein
LTGQKFVANPYNASERLYRSGDMARRLANGELEYLGRKDNQVKIRGFRIEPGEIENRLNTCPGVERAVVVARERQGETYLLGYYTAGQEISPAKLRSHLLKHLPDYAVPSHFVYLDELPLTAGGRVDREQLPEAALTVGEDHAAPANETEAALLEIWSDVLKLEKEKLSVKTSFFRYGGDSLKLITLINAIYKKLDVQLPITEMFDKTSVREQAEVIRAVNQINHHEVDALNVTEVLL